VHARWELLEQTVNFAFTFLAFARSSLAHFIHGIAQVEKKDEEEGEEK